MLFKQMTSYKASVINHSNTAGKQHVAIIHFYVYKEYQISTFLLEPLAKKVCSISFVSQYIKYWKNTSEINKNIVCDGRFSEKCVVEQSYIYLRIT